MFTNELIQRHSSAAILTLAFVSSLLFYGNQLLLFSISTTSLLAGLVYVITSLYDKRLHLPKTALPVFLTLFWVWMALSVLWSNAKGISLFQFWWISVLPLTFWIYVLDNRHRDHIWSTVSRVILFVSVLLVFFSLFQYFMFTEQPSSVFLSRTSHAAFLNLIAIPTSACFLSLSQRKNVSINKLVAISTVLFLFFFSIALSGSRGGLISLAIAMTLLIGVSVKHIHKRSILMLLALVVSAFVAAQLIQLSRQSLGMYSEIRPSLFDTDNRLIIWKGAWQMLIDSPWTGIGLGVYFLAWPPYRHPEDLSAGYFVHNDYLQLWIEIGLPGLLLLLLTMLSIVPLGWQILRVHTIPIQKKIEIIGLFCGLLAIAIHSFVDFNMYVMSIMLAAGLVLARFYQQSCASLRTPAHAFIPSKLIQRKYYFIGAILLPLIAFPYLIGLGIGDLYGKKASAQAKAGMLEEANLNFKKAALFSPWHDLLFIAHADLLRQGIPLVPEASSKEKKAIYDSALGLLHEAENINPLRWNNHAIRGKLYHENPSLAGERWRELSARAYVRALGLNPFLYKTRHDYALLLLDNGDIRSAVDIMLQGIAYSYLDSPELIPYYRTLITLLQRTGKSEEAERITELLNQTKIRLDSLRENFVYTSRRYFFEIY